MHVHFITDQIRNDFWYVGKCEHCGAEQERMTGYDDANYHDRVIPSIHCPSCGRNRAGDRKMDDKDIENIARTCHEANRGLCEAQGDNSQVPWDQAPTWQKNSAILGVRFCLANPDAPPSANHDSWLKEKTSAGWKYGPVKDETRKEHPCFVPYEQLPRSQQVKDHVFRAVVRGLAPPPAPTPSVVEEQQKLLLVAGTNFIALIDRIGQSREMSLARTNIEQAVMWGLKHVTDPRRAELDRPHRP